MFQTELIFLKIVVLFYMPEEYDSDKEIYLNCSKLYIYIF
jgi:hypothetical protein